MWSVENDEEISQYPPIITLYFSYYRSDSLTNDKARQVQDNPLNDKALYVEWDQPKVEPIKTN